MKKLITLTLLVVAINGYGQSKPKTTSTLDANTYIGATSLLSNFSIYTPPENYTYLFIGGKVGFGAKKAWLLTIKDTTKLSIKYADTIFILHISPKFVKKINDSTYTFKNN